MAITVDGKTYRSIQEQVEYNSQRIEKLEETAGTPLYLIIVDMDDFSYGDSYQINAANQYSSFFTTQAVDEDTKLSDLDFDLLIPCNASLEKSSVVYPIISASKSTNNLHFTTGYGDTITVTIDNDLELWKVIKIL